MRRAPEAPLAHNPAGAARPPGAVTFARGASTGRWGIAVAGAVVLAMGAHQVWYAHGLGGGLSRVADPYSEADAIRSGEGYAARGFAVDSGLPDLLYGGRYPEAGTMSEPALKGFARRIYTHYPPGPNWIVGLMTVMCGAGATGCYRALPIACGVLAMAFLAWSLLSTLGGARGGAALVLLACARMSYNMMHGLHYQGYALSLLLVQVGLSLRILRLPGRLRWARAVALALLGFAQGWLSFDYVFLVSLAALPLWLLQPKPSGRSARWQLAALTCLPAAGFALACLLHFAQVAHFLGGTPAALRDFRVVASWRLAGADPSGGAPGGVWGRWEILRAYVFEHLPRSGNLGKSAYLLALIALLALVVPRARVTVGARRRWVVTWQPAIRRARRALVLLAALAASATWILIMRNHAYYHPHFLPRHFLLLYFVAELLLLDGLTIERAAGRARPRSGQP
jgi:hypothetical protein